MWKIPQAYKQSYKDTTQYYTIITLIQQNTTNSLKYNTNTTNYNNNTKNNPTTQTLNKIASIRNSRQLIKYYNNTTQSHNTLQNTKVLQNSIKYKYYKDTS